MESEPLSDDLNYYVAVGASAGGLEALQEFFTAMPSDSGMAFMVVQHISPDFKSVMGQLLARHTTMDIFDATDGAEVAANSIYLIPPRKNMMIAEGRLLLVDQMPDQGVNFPIDIFFRSLAEDQHHRAIGIVLSGTGSDGSRGIRAIKEVGGLILVQDPNDAKFDGMPYNAVKTGLVDVVAKPGEIAEKLVQYVAHPMITGKDRSLINYAVDGESALQDIFQLLKERSEIDFTQYKITTVIRRIERRMGVNDMNLVQDYHKYLVNNPQELQTLAKDMLIGVTRFFRDPESFAVIEQKVIPGILSRIEKDEPIRVWVAGCSSGEEAYSIAILFNEALKKNNKTNSVKIFATDVDPDAIAEASSGIFNVNIADDVGPDRVSRYFKEKNDGLIIREDVRRMVVFANHNLIKDPPFSNTHLAVCRNVLIYFKAETQRRVLSMMNFSLQKNGYLFLGASESLGELKGYFEVLSERARIFRKMSDVRPLNDSIPPEKTDREISMSNIDQLLQNYHGGQKGIQNHQIVESLIDDYVPPCIVLTQDLNVLYVYGNVDRYTRKLKSGRFSANIKDYIREDLAVAVATAAHRALNEQKSIQYDEIRINDGDKMITISLRVRFVGKKSTPQTHLLLLFEEKAEQAATSHNEKVIAFDPDNQHQQRIFDLEMELQKNQEHLQVTVEELETTNEELQSSNEELLSANEELQSTNEELQSVNEELYTVNSEYQQKIEELTQVNSDLDLSMRSANVGILFLDDAMLIRNFNPVITGYINLLNSDIGRPFHHISHRLTYDGFLNDIAAVTDKTISIEKEIQTVGGKILVVKIAPYVNNEKEVKGCVITLTDVTDSYRLLDNLNESYRELNDTLTATFLHDTRATISVLVIDDIAADRVAIRRILESKEAGRPLYAVDEAKSITDATSLLSENHYDICIIDYKLGNDGDGISFVRSMSNLLQNLPAFILISGILDAKTTEQAIRLGIYDAVDKKHLSAPLLDRSVRYAIRQKRTEVYLRHRERLHKNGGLDDVAAEQNEPETETQ